MDATQFFSLTNQTSPVAGVSLTAVPIAKVEGRGAEFAELFQAQIQLQERQEFAAPIGNQVELQVLPLGPTLNLITPNSPLPDMFSLASFAKSQGLDDEAVKTLFGQASFAEEIKPVDILQVSDLILYDSPPASVALGATQPALVPVSTSAYFAAQTPNIASGVSINTFGHIKTLEAGFKAANVVNHSAETTAPTQILKLGADVATPASGVTGAAVSLLSVEISALPQVVNISGNVPVGPILEDKGLEVVNNVLRVRLEAPSEAVTQKLSEVVGAKEPLNWRALIASAALTGNSTAVATTRTELLTLEVPTDLLAELVDASADNLSPALTLAAAAPGDSINAPAPTGDSGEMGQDSSADQRNEQYQQVADRLGRAVAEKLMAQIERGQWKMQLRLQPESLGRIDVALEMHSGGLDALFSAENGATRELIAQGSGKLRDALTQSGMAVASVFVNSDQGRKSDGNPTSGRSYKGGSLAAKGDKDEVMPVASVSKRIYTSANGLDVLA